jgi:hypothetical protein
VSHRMISSVSGERCRGHRQASGARPLRERSEPPSSCSQRQGLLQSLLVAPISPIRQRASSLGYSYPGVSAGCARRFGIPVGGSWGPGSPQRPTISLTELD